MGISSHLICYIYSLASKYCKLSNNWTYMSYMLEVNMQYVMFYNKRISKYTILIFRTIKHKHFILYKMNF